MANQAGGTVGAGAVGQRSDPFSEMFELPTCLHSRAARTSRIGFIQVMRRHSAPESHCVMADTP
ncbi:hypothetical protein STAFG_1429 [Streptomyces afghaniensis 772]|uniref:Uncharacterized protein n=1 Tax=Streptomyces afghaniensis 772 TaxID=1283301 RepID=S4MPN9_9ACTN|nr:hypothetical protein [Streptomyces afghaniensis]EPJ41528.1 hypothetical protein STAFG_1429 [Streptomyces afghaniensis 772]